MFDRILTKPVRDMQDELHSISGFQVHYEEIASEDRILKDALGTYRFDSPGGHTIRIWEKGDGFDELRAAIEIAHGLLFFNQFPAVFPTAEGTDQICQLVTDTIHHPSMRSILTRFGFGESFDQYYKVKVSKWVSATDLLSSMCRRNKQNCVRVAFNFLEAMLVSENNRKPIEEAFSSQARNIWEIADEGYSLIQDLFPTDPIKTRKAILRCLNLAAREGMETKCTLIPPVLEEDESVLLSKEVFDIEETALGNDNYEVSIGYRRDHSACILFHMGKSELVLLHSASTVVSASKLSDWINASWRGKDFESFLKSFTGSE